MKKIYKSIILASLFIIGACSSEFENNVEAIEVNSGDADFSKYVAIGNSLTSGYLDGTLYKSGQENSYPAIIAGQMKVAGGGEFTQPLMPNDIGGFSDLFEVSKGNNFYGKFTLQIINGTPTPVPSVPKTTLAETFVNGLYNNMGVPGAKSYHLLADGYGNPQGISIRKANPYFARFASSPNTSVLKDVMAQNPTFFTLWIGNNDVLSYASGGAAGADQSGNINPATYGENDLSDANMVGGVIQKILEKLVKEQGAKGAIANIPNVQDIPFFTTIPSKPLESSNEAYKAQIPMLNEFYSKINQVYDALGVPERKINFSETGNSGLVIRDESLPNIAPQMQQVLISVGVPQLEASLLANTYGQTRQSKEGDLFVLTFSRSIAKVDENVKNKLMGFGLPADKATQLAVTGLTYPVQDQYVLTPDEVKVIRERTTDINNKIAGLARSYGLAYIDMNAKMKELKSGIRYNGVDFNAQYIKGGAFSLDGVHLNSRGYAVTANEFIKGINAKYNSNLRQVDANNYPGTQLP
ncbi:G-D-S-L family lipolytic protein [Weeksellaceae bacterium TAE3-ERU29]|nr:G-D-S-L family lipolytic protein [Weeksellaceae bacterium TAE3-ERU29]